MDKALSVSFLSSLNLITSILLAWSLQAGAIEEPRPAIFLAPRNFNPHPYEADLGAPRPGSRRTGPILFPPSPPPETEESNFITIGSNRKPDHPVDHHPYAKVARKYKLLNPGRHQEYDNQISPQISQALAGHARKVLRKPLPDTPFIDEQKNYAFSYKVVDHLTGDDFSHTQSQNEKATSGEYRVKLPDGRVQIVSYTADKNGYKADVKYEQDDMREQRREVFSSRQTYDYRDQPETRTSTESNSLPNGRYLYDHRTHQEGIRFGFDATTATPIHENRIVDYDYVERNKQAAYGSSLKENSGFIFSAVPRPPIYNDYQQPVPNFAARASQIPHYGDAIQQHGHHIHPQVPHRFRIIPQDKVEIVNQAVTSLGSTVAPAYLENPRIILSSTASPPFPEDYQHIFVKNIPGFYSKRK